MGSQICLGQVNRAASTRLIRDRSIAVLSDLSLVAIAHLLPSPSILIACPRALRVDAVLDVVVSILEGYRF